MTVKVVTDSTCDLPPEVARDLGIVVVPLSVHFGSEVYLDGVDLSPDEFYSKLTQEPLLPTTSQPSGGAFAEVYESLAAETEEILSLHISAKLSGTYNSALLGKDALTKSCCVEIVDTLQASMALGLIAIVAARAAKKGANLDQALKIVKAAIPRAHIFGVVDTLEYLKKGGRIGKAQAFLGTLLQFKPLITCQDGEVHPLERVRTRRRALDRLLYLVKEFRNIEELAVIHSTIPEEAEALVDRLDTLVPKEKVYLARFGPVIGTYLGPGSLGVALIGEKLEPKP